MDTLSGMSDPGELVPRNGSDKYLRILNLLHVLCTTIQHKLLKAFIVLCPWQCWSWAFPLNKQTLSTKNVLHCQMSQCSKSYYRTWSSPCYANHSILDADLQSCLQCIQQLKNTRREREEGRRTEAGRPRGGGSIMSMERKKRKLEDRKIYQLGTKEVQRAAAGGWEVVHWGKQFQGYRKS